MLSDCLLQNTSRSNSTANSAFICIPISKKDPTIITTKQKKCEYEIPSFIKCSIVLIVPCFADWRRPHHSRAKASTFEIQTWIVERPLQKCHSVCRAFEIRTNCQVFVGEPLPNIRRLFFVGC